MGYNIEVEKYEWETIIEELIAKGVKDRYMLESILLKFGERFGEWYILLNNEYWEEFNSYYNIANLLDKHFGIEDSFGVFLNNGVAMICNRSEYDVAEELGLDIDWNKGDE